MRTERGKSLLYGWLATKLKVISKKAHRSRAELYVGNFGALFVVAVTLFGLSVQAVEVTAIAAAAALNAVFYLSQKQHWVTGPLRLRKRPTIYLPTSVIHWQQAIDLILARDKAAWLIAQRGIPFREDVLLQAFLKNRLGGFAILDENLKVVGAVELWPMPWPKLSAYLAQKINGRNIQVTDLIGGHVSENSFYLNLAIPSTAPGGMSGVSERDLAVLRAAFFGLGELLKNTYLSGRRRNAEVRLYMLADKQLADTAGQIGFSCDASLTDQRQDGKFIMQRVLCSKSIFEFFADWDLNEADADIHLHKLTFKRLHSDEQKTGEAP